VSAHCSQLREIIVRSKCSIIRQKTRIHPKMLECKHGRYLARTGREPRGPGQRPGVEADVDSSRVASARLRRSPGSAEAGGVKGGPAGPSAADLNTAGYDFDSTDGGVIFTGTT
jgi:hypothetical protein